MSAPVPEWFVRLLAEHCAAWNVPVTRERVVSFWAVLSPLADIDVRQASLDLRRQSRGFPSAAEWMAAARQMRALRLQGRPGAPRLCATCADTGWHRLQCPGTTGPPPAGDAPAPLEPLRPCGATRPHGPHSYVVRCACRQAVAAPAAEVADGDHRH